MYILFKPLFKQIWVGAMGVCSYPKNIRRLSHTFPPEFFV